MLLKYDDTFKHKWIDTDNGNIFAENLNFEVEKITPDDPDYDEFVDYFLLDMGVHSRKITEEREEQIKVLENLLGIA